MSALLRRFDAWCRHGDFTVQDLARFRIIVGICTLLTLPHVDDVASYPADQFAPPPGPLMVFTSVPPDLALHLVGIATAVLAALLILGVHTRTVSVLLAIALMTSFGLTYSFGKIDHTVVIILVPLTMAFSSWGEALSLDARSSSQGTGEPTAQWPLRILAFMIGLAFVTAGLAKYRTGWLDLHTHAVQGHFLRSYFGNGRTDWLAPLFTDFRVGPVWELLDWFTVAMELGLVLAIVSWRWFRIAVAVVTLFHVGILLLMNIAFHANVVGYGAFVRWGRIGPARIQGSARITQPVGYGIALVVGIAVHVAHVWLGQPLADAGEAAIVLLGGAVAVAYLSMRLIWPRRRRLAASGAPSHHA